MSHTKLMKAALPLFWATLILRVHRNFITTFILLLHLLFPLVLYLFPWSTRTGFFLPARPPSRTSRWEMSKKPMAQSTKPTAKTKIPRELTTAAAWEEWAVRLVYLQEGFNYTRQNTARLDYASSFNLIICKIIFSSCRSLTFSALCVANLKSLKWRRKGNQEEKTERCERKLASNLAISCGWRKHSVSTCRAKLSERSFAAQPRGGDARSRIFSLPRSDAFYPALKKWANFSFLSRFFLGRGFCFTNCNFILF